MNTNRHERRLARLVRKDSTAANRLAASWLTADPGFVSTRRRQAATDFLNRKITVGHLPTTTVVIDDITPTTPASTRPLQFC